METPLDEKIILDLLKPTEFHLLENLNRIIIKEKIVQNPETDVLWRVESAGIYSEKDELLYLVDYEQSDSLIMINKQQNHDIINMLKIRKINKCRGMTRTKFLAFFIFVSTLFLGIPVLVLLLLPNYCIHELSLEDSHKNKMIFSNKVGFIRPKYLWSRTYFIQDENLETKFILEGPYLWDCNCCPRDKKFRVYENSIEVACITYAGKRNFVLEIDFHEAMSSKYKALIIAASFLWCGFKHEQPEV